MKDPSSQSLVLHRKPCERLCSPEQLGQVSGCQFPVDRTGYIIGTAQSVQNQNACLFVQKLLRISKQCEQSVKPSTMHWSHDVSPARGCFSHAPIPRAQVVCSVICDFPMSLPNTPEAPRLQCPGFTPWTYNQDTV